MSKTFLVTTPLFPVGRLDLAHCSLAAYGDAIARYRRSLGQNVTAITGFSEQAGSRRTTREPAVLAGLQLDYSRTLSTASPDHEAALAELFRRIEGSRFISNHRPAGAVCTRCETSISSGASCPDCGGPLESGTEECNVFRLSSFHEKLLGFYQDNPEFVLPGTRMSEVVNQVRAGLEDICVSRGGGRSGIRVPGNGHQCFTATLSALAGYLAGIGFSGTTEHGRSWPADVQLVSKDSLRVHAIYWPALLMAAGLEPPRHIVCLGAWEPDRESGYLKGRQSVPADELTAVLPADYIKYFLLREMPLGADSPFSYEALIDRVNSDLASEYSNLASRVFKMIENYSDNSIPEFGELEAADDNLRKFCLETVELHRDSFERFQINRALGNVGELISVAGKYIVANEPWVLARDRSKKQRLNTILYCAAEALRMLSVMLWPVVPAGAGSVLDCLNGGERTAPRPSGLSWGELRPGTRMGALGQLFPRVDHRSFSGRLESSRQREESVTEQEKPAADAASHSEDQRISIEDFAKVEMKVGKVMAAERVPQSDKLIKLQVDLGSETRQVVAGIGKAYQPDALLGRYVVIVTNLKPAKLMGVVSDGMIVAASQGGVPVLVGFNEPVEIGARLK